MIDRIRIRNFKCIKDENIKFSYLNVFSGVNGTGKSSFCQAILLLKYNLDGLKSNSDFSKFNLNLKNVNLGKAKDVLFESASDDEISFDIDVVEESELLNLKLHLPIKNFDSDYLNGVLTTSKNINGDVFKSNLRYIGAQRVGPKVVQFKDDSLVDTHSIGDFGEYAYSYIERFGSTTLTNIDNRCHIKSLDDSLIDQVSCWLREISPDINLKVKELDGTNLVNLSYSYLSNKGESNSYRATNVGFGITYCLPVILLCLLSKPGDVVIIDTPEAHLHPQGQVILGELLAKTASDGVQVLVETHSDHIINGVRKSLITKSITSDKIKFFHFSMNTNSDELVSYSSIFKPTINNNGLFDNWPKGFFDTWMITNKELLEIRHDI